METRLRDRVLDCANQLDKLSLFQADRNAALFGKACDGGLSVYINTNLCNNSDSNVILITAHHSWSL